MSNIVIIVIIIFTYLSVHRLKFDLNHGFAELVVNKESSLGENNSLFISNWYVKKRKKSFEQYTNLCCSLIKHEIDAPVTQYHHEDSDLNETDTYPFIHRF